MTSRSSSRKLVVNGAGVRSPKRKAMSQRYDGETGPCQRVSDRAQIAANEDPSVRSLEARPHAVDDNLASRPARNESARMAIARVALPLSLVLLAAAASAARADDN